MHCYAMLVHPHDHNGKLLLQLASFQKGYGDYLNRLMSFHFVPLTVIGMEEQIRKQVKQHSFNLNFA
jgi:hypothetical protein